MLSREGSLLLCDEKVAEPGVGGMEGWGGGGGVDKGGHCWSPTR